MGQQGDRNELCRVLVPRIEAALAHAGLTQADLVELTGLGSDRMSEWRRAKGAPSLIDICRIACACDVSLAWFFVPLDERKEAIAWANYPITTSSTT
jgi:transcriptional regulator with XRE-family HTH domain